MSEKIILNNNQDINIKEGSSISDIRVIFNTKVDMLSTWDMLTEENLKSVQIQNSDDVIVANYENLILDSETSIIQNNGTILTSFHLRDKTEVELLKERVEALENGQDIQDGAIMDLGEAVSTLSEQEDCNMPRFYGTKIINGTITIDQVPIKYRATTEEWLSENA